MDRNELKVQALLERVSQLTAQFENQAADYRVEITLLNVQLEEANNQLTELKPAEEPVVQEETTKPSKTK